MAERITVSQAKVLKHIAEVDPELAQEIGLSDEPEKKLAEEVLFAKLVKYERYKNLDLETLLIALDFWKTIFDTAIKYLSVANAMFMGNFLEMYSYIARAVEERLKIEKPSAKDVLVAKGLELLDEMKKNMTALQNPLGLNTTFASIQLGDQNEQKQKQKKRKRRAKAKA